MNSDDGKHSVAAIPFYCRNCNTDVKLKQRIDSPTILIACQCEVINVLDFNPDVMPEKWIMKGVKRSAEN